MSSRPTGEMFHPPPPAGGLHHQCMEMDSDSAPLEAAGLEFSLQCNLAQSLLFLGHLLDPQFRLTDTSSHSSIKKQFSTQQIDVLKT